VLPIGEEGVGGLVELFELQRSRLLGLAQSPGEVDVLPLEELRFVLCGKQVGLLSH
jgi:hypothetical protein